MPPDHNLGGSNKLLTLDEAADRLRIKTTTLRQNWRRWGIPAHKIDGLKFRERDINAFIARRAA